MPFWKDYHRNDVLLSSASYEEVRDTDLSHYGDANFDHVVRSRLLGFPTVKLLFSPFNVY